MVNKFLKLSIYAISISIFFYTGCSYNDMPGLFCDDTVVSYQNDIKPILEANCIKSNCHNGDLGAERNWSVLAKVQAKADKIKEFTGNGTMPLDIAPTGLPQNERDLIACWVNSGALDN
jgi:hypothetical protein